jgi:CRISPR-associated protein Csx17
VNAIELPGLHADPVQSYLAALGVLRSVAEQVDGSAALSYQPTGFQLHSKFSLDDLVTFFTTEWSPTPIVSPWNKGSGMRPDGSAAAATRALDRLAGGDDPRLGRFREAAATAQRIVLSFPEGTNLEKYKTELLRRCRAELPDAALDWFDASVVLLADDVVYPRLLGTGGNLGRMDLSANLLERLDEVIGLDSPAPPVRSAGWLRDLLTGEGSTRRTRATPGQFEPGAVGGVNSASDDGDRASVNPWGFVLALEGALLFASLPARRLGATRGTAAMPFTVRSDAAGGAGLADAESRFAELWLPLWTEPATFGQLRRLFGEGRLAWGRATASSSIDAARAIASFGTERGVEAFQRFALVERLGQSPLVVPVERYGVPRRRRPVVEATRALDAWVGRLRRTTRLPVSVAAALRRYDTAILRLAASEPGATLATLTCLAELDGLASRNDRLRRELSPLPFLAPEVWLSSLLADIDPAAAEVQLAVAAATAWDSVAPLGLADTSSAWPRGVSLELRGLDRSSLDQGSRPTWSPRADARRYFGDPVGALAAIHARHALGAEAFSSEHSADDSESPAGQRGVVTTFQRGRWVPFEALCDLVMGDVDERYLDRLLRCLSLIDPRRPWVVTEPEGRNDRVGVPDLSVLALQWLVVQQGRAVLTVPTTDADGSPLVRLRPAADWPGLLRRGRTARVITDAHRRFRVAGLPVLAPPAPPNDDVGRRLAAALLLPISGSASTRLVRDLLDPTRIDPGAVRLHVSARTDHTGGSDVTP